MASHVFFCCEDNCDAEAHVLGGRCDECFEMYITKLRKAHNPTRCESCREVFDSEHSDLLPSESGRFCGKWCEAKWLKEHDCNGFHYDEALEAYTCSECRACYPEHKCSGEIDYERGHYVCDDRDDDDCPQNRSSKERILLEIRNTETMLSWGYGDFIVGLSQELAQLREQLSQLAPACERCGKDYSVALAAHPTVCPSCAFERLHPCEGLQRSSSSQKCCADCGTHRTETEPVLDCEWYCAPCWKTRFSP